MNSSNFNIKNKMKMGIVVADEMEFKPYELLCSNFDNYKTNIKNGNMQIEFSREKDDKTINTVISLCGIGKVNAASAAAFLIAEKCDIILNLGLSGGIKNVKKEDIVFGTSYIEVDFDLTSFGYPLAKKPNQEYNYTADKNLLNFFKQIYPSFKCGNFGCGDSFLNSNEKKSLYKDKFDLISYDMESAAIASVCHKSGIPFLAIKKISDDGAENSQKDYLEMNDKAPSDLTEIIINNIDKLFYVDIFWT